MDRKNSTACRQVAPGCWHRRARIRSFGILALLALTPGVSRTGADYANATEALSQRLGQMQSFSANFNQRVEAENGQILENSEGVLHLRHPDRFFWQTFEPFPLIVYTDDTAVYLYEQDLAQVTERDLEEVLNSTPAGVILRGGHRLAEQFDVQLTPRPEENAQVFSLFPLAEDAEFLRIDLVFDQSALTSLFVEDVLGNRSFVHFGNRRLNEPIADEQFEVAYPEDVDWVRQ